MSRIALGTAKGGYVIEDRGGGWSVTGPLFPGWKVTTFGRGPDGSHLAALGSNWFGPALHRSDDFVAWEQLDTRPLWPEDSDRKLTEIWTLHNEGDRIVAGVADAGLFETKDPTQEWSPVPGLNEHPTRGDWQPGFGGLCAHRILTAGHRTWVAISAVGVFRSDDGGATFQPKNDGVPPVDTAEDAPRPGVGYCVHSLAADPADPMRIWRQDHRGVFRTGDGGDTWDRIENGLPAGFGFVMVRDGSSGSLFTVPLVGDENRVPVDGALRAYRSADGGDTWEVSGTGWSDSPQFTAVLRGAAAGDDQGAVCFGTTGGKVWITRDAGDTWLELPPSFPRIGAVSLLA